MVACVTLLGEAEAILAFGLMALGLRGLVAAAVAGLRAFAGEAEAGGLTLFLSIWEISSPPAAAARAAKPSAAGRATLPCPGFCMGWLWLWADEEPGTVRLGGTGVTGCSDAMVPDIGVE